MKTKPELLQSLYEAVQALRRCDVLDSDFPARLRTVDAIMSAVPNAPRAFPPERFAAEVAAELAMARQKHPGLTHSAHEGYAIMLEEVEEAWEEVMKNSQTRNPYRLRAELVQVAAMAQRMAEDLKLGE